MFIPKVYAFTYDFDASIDNTIVKKGAVKEITVSIKNIKDTSGGIAACSLNIMLDSSITLNSNVRTLNNWSMTHQDLYLFDTGSPVLGDTAIFVIPVKVGDVGVVKLTNIECSDGNITQQSSDVKVEFTIEKNSNSNNNDNNNSDVQNGDNLDIQDDVDKKDNNCDLLGIQLNQGEIEFDASITEYSIKVSDFDELEVKPTTVSDKASYTMDINKSLDGNSSVVITVQAENGNTKIYTIYVEEYQEEVVNKNGNNNYVPIFIVIIVILILINIFRIVRNMKNRG